MGYHCLPKAEPLKAADQDWSDRYNYVLITKEYPKPSPRDGKKKVTSEQTKEYNKMLTDRAEMFKRLDDFKEYQMFNHGITASDIISDFSQLWSSDSCFVYKIKPTSYRTEQRQYSSYKERTIYAFEVEEKYSNLDEVLDGLSYTYFFNKVLQKIFDQGHYGNEGYREKAIGYFTKYQNKKISLAELLKADGLTWYEYETWIHESDSSRYHDFAKYLLDNDLVTLYTDNDNNYEKIFNVLIRLGWFDIALDYINSFTDVANTYIDEIKKQCDTISILNQHNDDKNAREIIDKLDLNGGQIALKIMYYDEDDNEYVCKRKEFFNEMSEIRKFLIKEYDVDFEKASGEINGLCIDEDMKVELE